MVCRGPIVLVVGDDGASFEAIPTTMPDGGYLVILPTLEGARPRLGNGLDGLERGELTEHLVNYRGLQVRLIARELLYDGRGRRLTEREFLVARVLLHHGGEVVPSKRLLRQGWGEHTLDTGVLRKTVTAIRIAIGKLDAPFSITAIRGEGYVLQDERADVTRSERLKC